MNQTANKRVIVYAVMLAYFLYFLQGGVYDRGSIIPRISIVFILVVDVIYMTKSLFYRNSQVSLPIIALVILLSISWYISPKHVILGGQVISTIGELKNSLLFLLAYFPFRYWIDKEIINLKHIRWFSFLFFLVFVIAYFIKLREVTIAEYWKDDVTNNGGYMIAYVVPFLSIFFREKKYWIFSLVSLVLVLMSAKRGAILCFSLEFLLFVFFRFRTAKKINLIFLLLLITVSFYVAYRYIGTDMYLQERLQSDSSGRDMIYASAWHAFLNGDFFQKLFGHGFLQCIMIVYFYAHNDWLELLVDTGVTGVLIYFCIFFELFKHYIKRVKKLSDEYRIMNGSVIACWFTISIFSMGFLSPEACVLTIALAVSEKGLK